MSTRSARSDMKATLARPDTRHQIRSNISLGPISLPGSPHMSDHLAGAACRFKTAVTGRRDFAVLERAPKNENFVINYTFAICLARAPDIMSIKIDGSTFCAGGRYRSAVRERCYEPTHFRGACDRGLRRFLPSLQRPNFRAIYCGNMVSTS